jgi:hypothetical protein
VWKKVGGPKPVVRELVYEIRPSNRQKGDSRYDIKAMKEKRTKREINGPNVKFIPLFEKF